MHAAMRTFKLTLVVVHSLLLTLSFKPTIQECTESLSDYAIYKLVEDTIVHDPELLFKMRDAFFPTKNDRYWQVDGVKVLSISVCVSSANSTTSNMHLESKGENYTDLEETKRCWLYHWTNSRLLNLISGEILLAMDIVTTKYTYTGIVGDASLQLDLKIDQNTSMMGCLLASKRMERAVTSFLSWVSSFTIMRACIGIAIRVICTTNQTLSSLQNIGTSNQM